MDSPPLSPIETTTAPAPAPAPFDNTSTDIILRSSDGVDFHVWSIILREASPVFDDMLSIPQPPSDILCPDVPVVPLSENSKTLQGVLELCYPMAPGVIREKDLDAILRVLEAASKYNMDWPVTLFEPHLKELAQDQPMRVYAIAQRHRLPALAKYAAKITLEFPFPGEYCLELEEITGGAYFRLVKYHEECANVVRHMMLDVSWIGRRPQFVWYTCNNTKCPSIAGKYIHEGNSPRAWWGSYLDQLEGILRRRPCKKAVLGYDIEPISMAVQCGLCKLRAHIDLTKFREVLVTELESRISKVELEFK